MTTPMQKAAMAIARVMCGSTAPDVGTDDDVPITAEDMAAARAAFATLLPPIPEMIEAGFRAEQDAAEKANTDHLPLSQRDFLAVAFTAMMRATTGEK